MPPCSPAVGGRPIDDDPLDSLVAGLRVGSERAFTEVYEQCSGLLLSIALGTVGNRAMAEDVVQDAFVSLAQHVDGFEGTDGRALRAWLVRTTRNRAIDVRRSAAVRRTSATDVVPEHGTAPGADAELDRDLSPELAAALAELGDDERLALVLVHVGGLSGREVGEVLGRSRSAVYALLRRAERAVRARLG